jgi:adenylate cyclase
VQRDLTIDAKACVSCGFEQVSGLAACPRCGRKQPVPCAACSFPCDADFAFCPKCGASLGARARDQAPDAGRAALVDRGLPEAAQSRPVPVGSSDRGERDADRRQVTVLFADVTGFTTFSERLDPEDVRAFQNALFESLSQAVTRYEGFVAKLLGDAVLATFGAPIAHEDDPERALAAALDIRAISAELSEQWAPRLGQQVIFHIAVHTGPVVAGSFSASAGAGYDVTGDTVNTASRMVGAAAPGTILISEATYAATRHRFACEPAGELAMRGKAEPMPIYRLLGALAAPQSARGLAAQGLESPMVGRAEELAQLRSAFTRMQGGQAQVVSLVGEAGTGKSRLLAGFLAALEDDRAFAGTTVRRAGCSSLGEPTYGVVAALFREGYDVEAGDSLEVAREKMAAALRSIGARADVAEAVIPVLSYLLGMEEVQSRDFDPEQLKRQIALAARMLFERRLEQGPLLIVLEDLHWADAASLDLLRDLVDHYPERQLMMVVSHRPDVQPHLASRAAQTTIRLGPLSADQTRTLVTGLFSQMDEVHFARLEHFVATRAEGNPLFVEEIVRNLVSTGILVRRGNRWRCEGDVEAVSLPPTLHGLLLSRVDGLPADVRRLLQEAAVLGMDFDEGLLGTVASRAESAGPALERLLAADLIREVEAAGEGKRYRFSHALAHEAVYESLLISRRRELHERVGLALERAAGPRPSRLSDLEALGHHWSLASDNAKGARYLMAAGDRARTVYANADAIRHYERALRTLGNGNGGAQADAIRERLADLLALAGQRSDALAHYEAARQAHEKAGDPASAARLYRKIGGLHWEAGERERAEASFVSGLERLGDYPSPIERAQLFQERGRLAFRGGDNGRAIEWAERALAEIAAEEAAPLPAERAREIASTRSQAYNTLGVALARTGRLDEAVARIEQSIALAESQDLLQAACRGYTNIGVLYSSFDPRRSIETCRRGLAIAKKVGDLGFQSRLYANLAVAYCALTDRCEAEGVEAAQTAIDLDRRLGLLDHLAVPLIVMGQIHQCHGEHSLAYASYEEALTLAEHIGEPQLLFPCYDGLATLNLDAGNAAAAEFYLTKAQHVCEKAGLEPDALLILPFLC